MQLHRLVLSTCIFHQIEQAVSPPRGPPVAKQLGSVALVSLNAPRQVNRVQQHNFYFGSSRPT
eukprot:1424119-Amphidinium_carterae.1